MTRLNERMPCDSALKTAGFTLIEIMVVVVILGILAAVVVPRIMDRPDDARIERARTDIQSLGTALSLYKLDNFTYPSTDQGLEALVSKPANLPSNARWRAGGYIESVPIDPWNNPYRYLQPGTHGGDYDLYTTAADGQRGGEGVNADIGNWNLNQR